MAELLRVTCLDCGTSFVSAHQAMRASVQAGDHPGLEESCPHCGHADAYHPADYQVGSLTDQ